MWLWDGGTWNILSSADVDAVTSGDVDGDATAEVIADFGPVGLWLLDGGAWTQLSGVNPDFVLAANLDADANAELAVDFGPTGLWTRDGGAWTQLSGVDPDFIGAGSILGPVRPAAHRRFRVEGHLVLEWERLDRAARHTARISLSVWTTGSAGRTCSATSIPCPCGSGTARDGSCCPN